MSSLLPLTRANALLFAVVLATLTVGAMAIGEVHTGHGLWCGTAYVVVVGGLLTWLLFGHTAPPVRAVLADWRAWLAVLLLLAAVDQVHYAQARGKADPLTSAQALEVPGDALRHGREPYSVHLSHDAPISPGPGWIALLLPLTAVRATGLLGMLAVAVAMLCVARRSAAGAGVFCLVLLLGPLFESQAANGQDLYCITLAMVVLALVLETAADRTGVVAVLGVAAGLVGTSRLPMAPMLCVMGVGLWRRNRRSGWVFTACMLTTAVLLDGGFWLWARREGDRFQPLHVLGRGAAGAGYPAELAVAVLGCAALLWVVRRMRGHAEDWMLGTWMLMSAVFLPEAVKEFGQMHGDLRWEGSTYMTFPLPLLAAVLALRVGGSRILNASRQEQGSTAATWSAGA